MEGSVEKLVSDSKVHAGRVQATGRTSLGQPPKFKTNAINDLRPEQARALHHALEALREKSASSGRSGTPSESEVLDRLDAAFAEEVLGKLPKIVNRAALLDEINLDRVPDKSIRSYFDDAHRCYLYGFHVACAVLCRAIIESALAQIIDPKLAIKRNLNAQDSYIGKLVQEAKKRKILADDRPDWAIRIRDAGNDAIHNLSSFKKGWVGKLDEIVLNTRKVLLDLYASHG